MDGTLRLAGLILAVTGVPILPAALLRRARGAGEDAPSAGGAAILGGAALTRVGPGLGAPAD